MKGTAVHEATTTPLIRSDRARACSALALLAGALLAYAPAARSQAAIDCSIELYAMSNAGVFAAVNIATGARTVLGTAPVNLTEIEYDAATGQLWSTDGGAGNMLRRLNPATGAQISSVALNPAGLVTGMEFVGNTFYGSYSTGPGSPATLVTIDRTTGALTTIGGMGVSVPVSGLAYDAASSMMYGVTAGGQGIAALLRINPSTGASTLVGAIGNYTKIGSIEFGPDGNLYGGIAPDGMVTPGALLRINTATAAPTLVGLTGISGITGLSACPAAAPPPPPPQPVGGAPVPALSPLALAAMIALVALGARLARRRA